MGASATISIAKVFGDTPGGRFIVDGPYSGEEFRTKFLEPAFQDHEEVIVDLDGTYGFATSFLEEAFGGLSRRLGVSIVRKKLSLVSQEDPLLKNRIWDYIDKAVKS